MPSLRVPPPLLAPFKVLRELSQADFDALTVALAGATPVLRPDSLAASIASSVPSLAETSLAEVLSALTSLMGLRRVQGVTVAEIAERLASSEDLETPKKDRARFAKRVEKALDTRAVRLLGKAADLGSEHDKVFVGARILTDVRPIFGDDVGEIPEGAVMSHTLKLEFVHEEGTLGNAYVVLDNEDIQGLKVALERAEAKATTVKRMLEKLDVPYLGPED
jgi:hypothetical protein